MSKTLELLSTEAFLGSLFLVCREQTPASMTFPESHREDASRCWSGKGVGTEKGRSRLGAGPGFPSSDTDNGIFELFSTTFCSVTQLCLTLSDFMDCSTPGFPIFHHLPEFAQTLVH